MGMNVLVTGGAGFIGSQLVRRLVERGDRVRVLDNFSTGRRERLADLEGDMEVVFGDLRSTEDVRRAVSGIELLFHQGALPSVQRSFQDPLTTTAVIAEGTLNVMLAARDARVRRVVYASSSSVYGDRGELPRAESARPAPASPYAVAKLAAEGYCETISRGSDLETVALRYFNVFGPGQDPDSPYAAAVPRFIAAIQADEPLVVYGDGRQSRDFTHVDDVVEANLLAAKVDGVDQAVLNVAGGRPSTVIGLAEAIGALIGRAPRYQHEVPRAGEVRDSWADLSEPRRRLGYEPRVTLNEGLGSTIAAFRPLRSQHARPNAPERKPTRCFLVTGGAGFVGSHLVEALAARGDSVVVLDDLSTGRRANLESVLSDGHVELVEGSVLNAPLVDELMHGVEGCFHLASAVGVELIISHPIDSLLRNVRGTDVVISAAARHERPLVFTSSSEIYGKSEADALKEGSDSLLGSPLKARWAYANAKAFGEALAYGYFRQRGVRMTVARLFNTVGARQSDAYGMVLPRFVAQALAGTDLTVYGDGTQSRCFCHVADAVDALMRLSDCEKAGGRAYNVGSSTELTVMNTARLVIDRLGSTSDVRLVPYDQAYGDGFEELARRRPDTRLLRELTGWVPQGTIEQAIDDVALSLGSGAPARRLKDPAFVG